MSLAEALFLSAAAKRRPFTSISAIERAEMAARRRAGWTLARIAREYRTNETMVRRWWAEVEASDGSREY